MYDANDGYSNICCNCADDLFVKMCKDYEDSKTALIVLCHYIDVFFSETLYEALKDNINFSFGNYKAKLALPQYKNKSFTTFLLSLLGANGLQGSQKIQENKETQWSKADRENKQIAIDIIGYDPFEGYEDTDRKFLFNDLTRYFDDDISDDTYKLSQVIQIVNNNNQIRNIDLTIARLSKVGTNIKGDEINQLINIKKNLVVNNDKIAKENEISVKNRSNKEMGKSTLGYLQRDLRQKDFKRAEEDYYDQLQSEGTYWAIKMSHKAVIENSLFDENDKNQMFAHQRKLIDDIQNQLDTALEKIRVLQIEVDTFRNADGDLNE